MQCGKKKECNPMKINSLTQNLVTIVKDSGFSVFLNTKGV